MKKFLLVAAALVASLSLSAQIKVGEQIVSGTIGVINTVFPTNGFDSKFPPVTVSYEHGLLENAFDVEGLSIGVGGYFGYANAKQSESYSGPEGDYEWGWTFNDFVVAAKGYAHYDVLDLFDVNVEKLDTYATFTLGLNIASSVLWGDWYGEEDGNASNTSLSWGFQLGARYWLTEQIAANLEVGYGIAFLNFGVSYRF